MSDLKVSVRDKRRAETLSLIHKVARDMALDRGLSDTRVEDIASGANVSRRTFFNYYATKEEAVLGIRPPTLSDESIEKFQKSQEAILPKTVWLVVGVIRTTTVTGSTGKMRKELRKRFPELAAQFEVRTQASGSLIRQALLDSNDKALRDLTESDIEIILGLAHSIVRYAYLLDSEIKDDSVEQSITSYKTTIRKIL